MSSLSGEYKTVLAIYGIKSNKGEMTVVQKLACTKLNPA